MIRLSPQFKLRTFAGAAALAIASVFAASCSNDDNGNGGSSSSSSSGGGSSSSGSGSSGGSGSSSSGGGAGVATTPIQHVILIIGENRTFDHVYATYTPHTAGQTVSNLLSKGIVNADGTPGPNVALAKQFQATASGAYSISPTTGKTAYATLPPMIPVCCRFSAIGCATAIGKSKRQSWPPSRMTAIRTA